MNISEEDGEDLPSKTSPATHKLTLKRGHVRETTAPPRTKKKLSDSVEGGNIFDRSSSSPPKDSTSDPPVKKAKLLNASSASCGEALSQKVNVKLSLKRAASTDSEDEMSSDGSKTDIFKERDDGDKARCVRQYSNRVKAKRKAEELPSAPQERSQDSSAAPTVTVQMDHDYGRASDTVSTQSLNDGNSDIHEKNNQFVNQESLVHSTQSESSEILISAEESLKTDSQFQCTSFKAECNPNSLVNDAPASHRESSNCAAVPEDCITSAAAVNENKNVVESVISQKDSGESEDLLSATLNSSTTEANPGCQEEPQAGERAASGQTSMCSETENKDATKRSDSQPVETTTSSCGPLETQMDRSVREDPKSESLQHCVSHDVPDTTTGSFDGDHKIVRDPEESERKEVASYSAPTLAVPGTALDVMVRRTDSTTEDAEAVGEQHQTEIDSASEPKIDTDRQPDSAQKEDLQIDKSHECSGHPAEVTEEPDHERASTPDTQIKMDVKPSGQDLSNGAAPEETEITTDSNEHSEINSTVEHQDNMNLDNSSGPKSPETAGTESFNSDCTVEAPNRDRKDTGEPERDGSAGDHGMAPEHSEKRTEVMPESSSPDASEHAVDRCDEVQDLPVVCQSKQDGGPDVQTASEDTSNAAATYEIHELTQPAADISERVEHPSKVQTLEDHGSDGLVPTESASPTTTQRDIDFQTMAASEEICTPTEATEVAVQEECESSAGIQQEDQVEAAPEPVAVIQTHKNAGINVWRDQEKDVDGDATTGDCAVIQMETTSAPAGDLQSCQNLVANLNGAEGGKEVTKECCDGEKEEVKHSQLQTDVEPSATAGEISVASSTAEVERPQGPDVTNPDTEVQENPVTEAFETQYTSVDTADSLRNIGSAAEEEMTSYQQSRVEAQRSDKVSDLSTDVQQDLVSEGDGSKRDEDKMTREERDSVALMHMGTAAEEVSDSPCAEAQNHKGRKIREGDSGVYQDVGREDDEDKPVTECADISEVTMPNPEELSSQTVLMQSCQSVEMSEVHGEEEKVSESYGAKVDEDVVATASISIPEPQMSTEDSEGAEEIPTTVNGEDHRSLEPHELAESLQNDAVRDRGEVGGDQNTTDRIHVPEARTTMETNAPPEETPSPPTEDQSYGGVEMLELDKDVKEDGVEHKVIENLSMTECVTHPESQMNREASRVPVEIPSPPATAEIQSREKVEIMGHGSEVNEMTDSCAVALPECNVGMESNSTSIEPLRSGEDPSRPSKEFEPDLLTATCESKMDEDAFAAECVSIPEPHKMETTAATEGISSRPPTLDTGGEVCEPGTDVQNDLASFESKVDEESGPAGSVEIPEAPVETTATQEQISNFASAVEQECQETVGDPPNASVSDINEPPTVAASENKEDTGSGDENKQGDTIRGSREGHDSALEEEANMQVTQADEEPAMVSTEQPDAGHKGGSEQREVTLLVFASGERVPPLEEQVEMIAQPEEEIQSNQVVYEPISSPESSDDRDVPAASQNHVGFSVLGMEETIAQQMEGGPSADDNITAVCTQVASNTEQQSQVPDSQEEEMRGKSPGVPDSCASVGAEQSGKVKQVAVISSSDDIRVPEGQVEGAVEGSENTYPDDSGAAESSEVVHEVAGIPEGTVLTLAESTATTMFALPDSTSEEYVILEPVPQSEINFDIVTQAAAESGLSVPFAAEVNPGVAQGDVMNGPQVMVLSEADVPQSQAPDATEALNQKIVSPADSEVQNSDPRPSPSAHTLALDTSEVDTQMTSQDCPSVTVDTNEVNLGIQEVQILEDMEIGREVVLAEEDNEEDGDVSVIGKIQKKAEPAPPEVKLDEKNKNEDSSDSKLKQNTAEKVEGEKKEPEEVKPKKQQMNTQARTKARLAALAEQKAAAAKKSANRHQLNLLALCQEIAEDIETDSMLLKKIEEEKQAAAAAAAAAADVASKHEASEESPHANAQANADTAPASAPTGPEASLAPTDEASPTQPPTADATEAKPADEPPKRRFFISQVSVPLKAHEKKKLTRYQRLRQVELQREKMSWARVKKLKSDQANQMFSDIDWQEPLNAFSQFSMNPVAKAPPPIPGPAKTPPPSVASTSKSEPPNKEVPKLDPPKDEPVKTEPIKAEPVKTEPIKTEATEAEPTKTEPAKSEEAKSNLAKPEAAKSSPLNTEVRRSTRQTKAQAAKETPAPGPSPKVTRSAAKKKLPAVPPPMPNGLNAQKQTPVEYKPYKPKPKYSFEDFELDDDPVPVAPARASPHPQQTRPNIQQAPTAQSKPRLPAQPPSQTLLKARTAPAGQESAPSISAVATKPPANTPATAGGSSNAAPSAKPQLKPAALSPPPPKASSAPGQPRPAASPLLKPSSGREAAHPGQSTSATSSTCAAGTPPEKTLTPPSAESSPLSAPPSRVSPEGKLEMPDASKRCEEKPSGKHHCTHTLSYLDFHHSAGSDCFRVVWGQQLLFFYANLTFAAADGVAPVKNAPAEKMESKTHDGRTPLSEASLQKELKKHREADKDGTQTIIVSEQQRCTKSFQDVINILAFASCPASTERLGVRLHCRPFEL